MDCLGGIFWEMSRLLQLLFVLVLMLGASCTKVEDWLANSNSVNPSSGLDSDQANGTGRVALYPEQDSAGRGYFDEIPARTVQVDKPALLPRVKDERVMTRRKNPYRAPDLTVKLPEASKLKTKATSNVGASTQSVTTPSVTISPEDSKGNSKGDKE